MISKIVLGLAGFGAAAVLPVSALAANPNLSIRPIPYPSVRIINVTPGNPLHLGACGKLEVGGRGWVRYENFNGGVEISVRGALAVKEEDLGNLNINGFNWKHQRGSYIVYHGRGTASGNGSDLDLVVLGKAKIGSYGCGQISLKGYWQGTFQPFWIIHPLPEPVPLPLPVELNEVEAEVMLVN